MTDDLDKKEAIAEQYVRESRTREAIGAFYELIASHAGNKNFEKAEALRDRLYDVDPMAITEIVRASDIIEAEKAEARDENHLQTWAGLYESLSDKEANALYFSMKNASFEAGEVIAPQGELCGRLYFINRGEAKVAFKKDSEEMYLMSLRPGDVFGSEPFFSSTVCTVSVVALSGVQTVFLEKKVLDKWKADVPVLEARLFDFCMERDRLGAALKKAGVERRKHKRIPVYGRLMFQIFAGAEKPNGKENKSELADLSKGGVAFVLKTPKPENARILLGRRLKVRFEIESADGTSEGVERLGCVTAVRDQGFDDYSVHLQFDEPLAESIMQLAAKQADSGTR
ncbi:MAG: cyclic nucleotide-binding domain-containing protein [Thermodesulfobacteriota bacterium]